MGKKKNKNDLDTTEEFNFIKWGQLNMICLRNGKEVEKVETNSEAFLSDPRVVRQQGQLMENITFQPNVVFKVTLDFDCEIVCVEGGAVRESTDWVLCSCMGNMAHFNRVEERLMLQQCVVCIPSNIDPLVTPFHLVLRFEEEQWVVERMYR